MSDEADRRYLIDATLLVCYFLDSLPENSGVVETQGGDTRHHWLGNDVRAIVQAAHSDLQDGRIHSQAEEGMVCYQGHEAEICRHLRRFWVLSLRRL